MSESNRWRWRITNALMPGVVIVGVGCNAQEAHTDAIERTPQFFSPVWGMDIKFEKLDQNFTFAAVPPVEFKSNRRVRRSKKET